jgi:phosphoribosylformimino-5-aminoimidazole carboxamide ribonucleotide (ProFAR) isomerase
MSQRKLIRESNAEFSNVQTVRTVEHTVNTARSNINVVAPVVKAPSVQVSTGGGIRVNQASTVQVNAQAPRQVEYEYHDRPTVVKAGPHLKDPS